MRQGAAAGEERGSARTVHLDAYVDVVLGGVGHAAGHASARGAECRRQRLKWTSASNGEAAQWGGPGMEERGRDVSRTRGAMRNGKEALSADN